MGSGKLVVVERVERRTLRPGRAGLRALHRANRRYPDLTTQRLVKAAIADRRLLTDPELQALATHCTVQGDAAYKVERQIRKSAAALLLDTHRRLSRRGHRRVRQGNFVESSSPRWKAGSSGARTSRSRRARARPTRRRQRRARLHRFRAGAMMISVARAARRLAA